MPVNNIVTNKFGISMISVSGDIYRLMSANESSSIPRQSVSQVDIDIQSTSTTAYAAYITENNLVQNNLLPGDKFCYTLYEGASYEVGFAEILNSGGYKILDRKNHIYFFNGENKTKLDSLYNFSGPYLFLQVSPPPSLDDSLVYENSVLCTSSSGISSVVLLHNDTILGCKNNSLQSIDGNEFIEMFGDNIPTALENKSISCTALNLYSIRLLPSGRPLNPPRGTIIYNDQSNIIEFYNGTSWSAL